MEISVLADPGILHEIPRVDHEDIAFPFSDRVTVVRRICFGAMRPAVGRNDAVRITGNVFVEKNRLGRQLHDLSRGTDTWYAGLSAVEHRIEFALVIRKF